MTSSSSLAGFNHKRYVPLVLAKRGERRALRELPATVKLAMTPLFVVPPVEWDYDKLAPKKSVDAHLARQPDGLRAAWGTSPAFLDLQFVDGTVAATGEHALVWFTELSNNLGLPLVPTTGIDRSPNYLRATAQVQARDRRGVCLRLTPAEWPTHAGRRSDLDSLLHALAVTPAVTDLVLDVADQVVADGPGMLRALAAELSHLPYAGGWRSVTVMAAGFPRGAGDYSRGMNAIERLDWQLYQQLVALIGRWGRLPSFGDYVVAHPDPTVDVNPRFMQTCGTLRYTAESVWLFPKGMLFRGRKNSGLGAASIPPIADLIRRDHRFLGAGHCSTDQWIVDVAKGVESGSNPETWRRRGSLHHLQLVTEQLASLTWP